MVIPISKPVVSKNEIDSVVKVLRSGHLIEGKVVNSLEKRVSVFCSAKYAIAVNSGTAALHASLHALGVKPGDEILTTPFTFVATANAIRMVGATPMFIDITENTFLIDTQKIEERITNKTKGIIAVDLYGQPADYDEIYRIAKRHNLFVLGDAAQSIGAVYHRKRTGNLADISTFSLYATKNIMCGEGGIITTNNKTLADKVRVFKNHGQSSKYNYHDIGFNYRLTDVLASIALPQIKHVDTLSKRRQQIAEMYSSSLSNIQGIVTPTVLPDRTHVFHQYTIRVTDTCTRTRDDLRNELAKRGIQTMIYYPTPLYKFAHLQNLTTKVHDYPVSQKAAREVLSLPVFPALTQKEIRYIIHSIKLLCAQ